jgi:hypothetical protein
MKAGAINVNRMTFTVDNETYECTATGADRGEVWVYHDPTYKPAGNWTQDLRSGASLRPASEEFFASSSDSFKLVVTLVTRYAILRNS